MISRANVSGPEMPASDDCGQSSGLLHVLKHFLHSVGQHKIASALRQRLAETSLVGAPGAFSMEQLRHRAAAWSSRVRPSSFCFAHTLKCSAQAVSLCR